MLYKLSLLLKNVFHMAQYVLGLVLGSKIFFTTFEYYLFFNSKWRLTNLVDSERTEILKNIDCFFF